MKIFHLPALANSTHLDDSEEVVKVKNSGMDEILSVGAEPPKKAMHFSMGLRINPKIQPPDHWSLIIDNGDIQDQRI